MVQVNGANPANSTTSSIEAVLAALKDVSFPGATPEQTNRNMRTLLEQIAPLVMKGTIRTIQGQVNDALAMPVGEVDESREYGLSLLFALQASWQYVHWDSSRGPIPADRQRMRDLYRAMWDANNDGYTPY